MNTQNTEAKGLFIPPVDVMDGFEEADLFSEGRGVPDIPGMPGLRDFLEKSATDVITAAPVQADKQPAAAEQTKVLAPTPATASAVAGYEPEIPEKPDDLIVSILRTKRAYGSAGDINFRLWLFNYIKTKLGLQPQLQEPGNILVSTDPKSSVLFSCHTDTVHNPAESDGSMQDLAYDPGFGHIFLQNQKSGPGCLGGDDGVGVYIMLRMLERGVKGHYIFHTGEERGGIGAKAFVKAHGAGGDKWLDGINQVVAFDRPVNSEPEVIIRQGGTECASARYGTALAAQLNKYSFERKYVVSERGVYTDSKEYRYDVPECVNLGCFYSRQHTPNEVVDYVGVLTLLQAACEIDWEKLPIERKPGAGYSQAPMPAQGSWSRPQPAPAPTMPNAQAKGQKQKHAPKPQISNPSLMDEMADWYIEDFIAFVDDEPNNAAHAMLMMYAKLQGQQAALDQMSRIMGV